MTYVCRDPKRNNFKYPFLSLQELPFISYRLPPTGTEASHPPGNHHPQPRAVLAQAANVSASYWGTRASTRHWNPTLLPSPPTPAGSCAQNRA